MSDVKYPPTQVAAARVSTFAGWALHEYDVADSTNLTAAGLPAWSAVRADVQTAGRGRFQRNWVSDAGGLWLSAVVPSTWNSPPNRALPLAAGLAVFDALRSIGVPRLRMRWPNDLLADNRKLAGLLVDQFKPGLAVVGIGINVTNRPEARDAGLRNQTARLADLVAPAPGMADLTALVLRHLRRVMDELVSREFPALLGRMSALWGPPRRVELDLDGVIRTGVFNGVDEHGALILSTDAGQEVFSAHQVTHLRELS